MFLDIIKDIGLLDTDPSFMLKLYRKPFVNLWKIKIYESVRGRKTEEAEIFYGNT